MQAKDIYAVVSSRLQDMMDPRRWPWESSGDNKVNLERFLDNATLSVVSQRPDATASIKTITLSEGSLQTLSVGDLFLLDCLYFLDEGKPVHSLTRINRADIDAYSLNWPSKDSAIYHWAYERAVNPRNYWVVSGAKAGDKIMASVSKKPTVVTSPTTKLNLTPTYQPALVEAVLYQVFASDTSDTNYQKAMGCLETFARILGVKFETDVKAPFITRRSEGN